MRNASRLLNVESAKLEETARARISFMARPVSGWRARKFCTAAGSGLPLAGSGLDASSCS